MDADEVQKIKDDARLTLDERSRGRGTQDQLLGEIREIVLLMLAELRKLVAAKTP